MKNLNSKQLMKLYINYTSYRDNICNGHAELSVYDYYKKYGIHKYKSSI